ncbi:hypothetical protein F2Q69_00054964 [Brassica cretica]|uniref:Uncharacterized protein n=1 Tax=Brassica cretica TaxID=69181 RepID=A0A8S9N8T5_BRACR|nr:hypothetical protein F2Q69_00054964 [Brassica cretica]
MKSIQNLNSLGLGKLLIHNNGKITSTRKKERVSFSPSFVAASLSLEVVSLSLLSLGLRLSLHLLEKRNKGFEKWLESFKARIHQSITNPCPSSVFEEDHEAKDIEPELSTVYVSAKSKDDLGPIFDEEEEPFGQWTMDDDFDPIFDEEDDHLDDDLGPIFDVEDDHLDDDYGLFFDEEEKPEAVSVFLAVQKVAEDVVDSGPEADHENDLTTTYASGEETPDQSNNNQALAKKIAKVELKNVGSFILEGLNFRTNSCKGGGDDATQISRYVSTRSLRYEPVKQLIIAWLNEHFMGLIGLIHEVLDREKLMGLMQNGEALCSIRNQCLDLSKKCPPRKYKPWSVYQRVLRSEPPHFTGMQITVAALIGHPPECDIIFCRIQKPQSKLVVETPSTRTEEKRNKGFEKWLESFKARIHQSITNPCPSSVFEEDHEAKDIEPELSTVYVRAKSKDDLGPIFDEEEESFGQWTMDDDFDPIFDEEDDHLDDDLGPIFDEEDDHLDDDSGLFFDEEEEPELHEEGLQHFIFEPGEETRDQSNNNQSLVKKIAKVELKNVGSFILEGLNLRTNSCKGGGDDATQIRRYVSTRSLRYEPVKQLIIAWLNEHFMGLIGLIHEVLDREKLMGLKQNGEALCSIRNQCLDLSKKCPPRKYKPWSYNISI